MRTASRMETLQSLIALRRMSEANSDSVIGDTDPGPPLKGVGPVEDRILEIAELYFRLQADGFPVRQIFERIGWVHTPSPDLARLDLGWDPLSEYLLRYVRSTAPNYLLDGTLRFRACLAIATLWAELLAERTRSATWPRPDMLEEPGRVHVISLRFEDEPDEADDTAFDSNRPIPLLDRMLARCAPDHAGDWRRFRARIVPGDEVRNYSTGNESFAMKMGSSGLALVRDGRAIDYVELIRN
jgi:hypothetical protein